MAFLAALAPALAGGVGAAAGSTSVLSTLATVATIAGAGISAVGQISQGNAQAAQAAATGRAQAQAAEFEAKQLDIRQKEAQAEGTRKAALKREQGAFALSKFRASSAASGFSASDPTSIQLEGQLESEIELQADLERANAFSRANQFGLTAAGTRFSGESALRSGLDSASAIRTGSRFSAAGTAIGGFGTAFDRFNQNRRLGQG